MKKIICIIVIAIVILMAIAGFAVYKLNNFSNGLKTESSDEVDAINSKYEVINYLTEVFDNYINQNSDDFNKLFGINQNISEEISNSNKDLLGNFNIYYLLKGLSYEIDVKDYTKNTVTVSLNIQNYDSEQIIDTYVKKYTELSLRQKFNQSSKDEVVTEANETVENYLNSGIEKVSNTIELDMVKDGEEWIVSKMNYDENILNYIFPNLKNYIKIENNQESNEIVEESYNTVSENDTEQVN